MVSEEVPPLLGLFEYTAFFVTWVAILSLHCAGVAVIGAVDRTILLRKRNVVQNLAERNGGYGG